MKPLLGDCVPEQCCCRFEQFEQLQVSKDWTNAVRRLKKAKLENDLTKQLSEQKVTRELATLVSAKKDRKIAASGDVRRKDEA